MAEWQNAEHRKLYVLLLFFSSSSFLTLLSVLNEIREFWLRAGGAIWIPAGQEIDVYFSPRNPLR